MSGADLDAMTTAMNPEPHRGTGAMTVSVTSALDDPDWDRFLQSIPQGEFEQGCCWAQYKQTAGWQCSRTLIRQDQEIIAGFQLLWRPTRFGRIGYVSRGPVAADETRETVDRLVELLIESVRRLRLAAMVVHPPARSQHTASRFPPDRFAPNRLLGIITATLFLDVSSGMEAVEAQMSQNTRKHIRQAARKGITVREGSQEDIGTFFRLMFETCRRQNVRPNPPTESAMRALWEAWRGSGGCRLTIAEYKRQPISGLLCMRWGDVLTLWKKGSLPEHFHGTPMELLYYETFLWAHQKGYRYCDFGSVNLHTAETLIQGMPLSEEQKTSRDFFNLKFGGNPVLLPGAYLYFSNPLGRWAYRLLRKNEWAQRYLNKFSFA